MHMFLRQLFKYVHVTTERTGRMRLHFKSKSLLRYKDQQKNKLNNTQMKPKDRVSFKVQERDGTAFIELKWKRKVHIHNVRQEIYNTNKSNLPANVCKHNLLLMCNGIELSDNGTLHDYVNNGDIIVWHADRTQTSTSRCVCGTINDRVYFKVHKRDGPSFTLRRKRKVYIHNVRQEIYNRNKSSLLDNVSKHNLVLTCNGTKLSDNKRLCDYNVNDSDIITWDIDQPKVLQTLCRKRCRQNTNEMYQHSVSISDIPLKKRKISNETVKTTIKNELESDSNEEGTARIAMNEEANSNETMGYNIKMERVSVNDWSCYSIVYWFNTLYDGIKYMELRKQIVVGKLKGSELASLNPLMLRMMGIHDSDEQDSILNAIADVVTNDDFENVFANTLNADDIPRELMDPVLYQLIKDPVGVMPNGYVYERSFITQYIAEYKMDPMTKVPAILDWIVECPKLKNKIASWKKK
eukprot:911296_1